MASNREFDHAYLGDVHLAEELLKQMMPMLSDKAQKSVIQLLFKAHQYDALYEATILPRRNYA